MALTIGLDLGTTRQINVVPKDAQENVVSGVTPTYSTNDESVAVVTSTGLIVPVESGVAIITVSVGGVSSTIVVVVGNPVNDITVVVPPITAYGTPVTATATVHDSVGGVITGLSLLWSTNADPDVAVINQDTGVLTVLADGTFDVICTYEAIAGKTNVVVSLSGSITISPANPTIIELATQAFTAVVRDATGTIIPGAVVVWSVPSGGSFASIGSSSGIATGLGVGAATIRATSGAIHGDTTLNVALDTTPASVVVAPSTASILVGQTQAFSATVKNANNTTIPGATVAWSSLNTGVATVNSSTGVATGVSVGSATIRATSGTAHGDATATVGTDVTNLVATLGGDSNVPAFYSMRYNVTASGGMVDAVQDARGAGFGPNLVGTGTTRPAYDAVNKRATSDGVDDYLATAASALFALNAQAKALVFVGTVSGGNNRWVASISEGTSAARILSLLSDGTNIKTCVGSGLGGVDTGVPISSTIRIVVVTKDASTGQTGQTLNHAAAVSSAVAADPGNNQLWIFRPFAGGGGLAADIFKAAIVLNEQPSAGHLTALANWAVANEEAVLAS